MKKWLKRILKISFYMFLSFIGVIILSTFLDDILFHFKITKYNNELDSLFNKRINNLYIEFKYKSGNRGIIYYVSVGTSKLTIIEANNFRGTFPSNLKADSIEKIKLTDGKTYSTIIRKNYPTVEAALNPKKSDYLKIFLLKPYSIKYEEHKDNHFYLTGNFRSIVFSNSQLCYIITSNQNPELLILIFNNKLYLIVGAMKNGSLLDIINPEIL